MKKTIALKVLMLIMLLVGNACSKPTEPPESADSNFEATKALADQGSAEAQLTLGVLYRLGTTAPQNPVEALKWFTLAANQGNSQSQRHLGEMYYQGEGVPQDFLKAYVWFSLAMAQRDGVGEFMRDEAGAKLTPQDLSQAQALATKCFESNYKYCE